MYSATNNSYPSSPSGGSQVSTSRCGSCSSSSSVAAAMTGVSRERSSSPPPTSSVPSSSAAATISRLFLAMPKNSSSGATTGCTSTVNKVSLQVPSLSCTRSVIVWLPALRLPGLIENVALVDSNPSRLETHWSCCTLPSMSEKTALNSSIAPSALTTASGTSVVETCGGMLVTSACCGTTSQPERPPWLSCASSRNS